MLCAFNVCQFISFPLMACYSSLLKCGVWDLLGIGYYSIPPLFLQLSTYSMGPKKMDIFKAHYLYCVYLLHWTFCFVTLRFSIPLYICQDNECCRELQCIHITYCCSIKINYSEFIVSHTAETASLSDVQQQSRNVWLSEYFIYL